MFEEYHLLTGYTVLENILLAVGTSEDNETKAIHLLESFGISEKVSANVEDLSGGQKQRVAIARALINDPAIILADEPTVALDRNSATQILEQLKKISKDRLVIVITLDHKVCEYGG